MHSTVGTALVAALAAMVPVAAAKDGRTFAVLRFHGNGPLTTGRADPIVNPGKVATHLHTVQGASGFSNTATGADLVASNCSTADIKGDKSAYWMPSLFFHDKANNTFEPVELFYMNVYYFFEGTNDVIKPFPVGLQMVSGDASKRTPPATGADQLDPAQGPVQPAQFTCPRTSFDPASYPADSDGSMAGIQDPNNKGAGAGFPFAECDASGAPLRADLHFPSCYDPSKALTDYENNMQFPMTTGTNKQDCPEGWVHTPHLFYEMYWNTPKFAGRWTPNAGEQPFVLSNGDATGFSLHGDFISGWDQDVLQHIIDTCDAGDSGMDQCPGVETVLEGECHIENPDPEPISGVLTALPGNNPIFGWAYGGMSASTTSASSSSSSSSTSSSTTASLDSYDDAKNAAVGLSATASGSVSSAISSTSSSVTTSIADPSARFPIYVNSSSKASSPAGAGATQTTLASGSKSAAPENKHKGHGHGGGACRAPTSKKDTTMTATTTATSSAQESDTTTYVTIHSTTYTTATTYITVTDGAPTATDSPTSAAPSVGTIAAYRRREAHVRRHARHH